MELGLGQAADEGGEVGHGAISRFPPGSVKRRRGNALGVIGRSGAAAGLHFAYLAQEVVWRRL
jgi:hypothetical protein